jgi:hypothetical protein
VWSSPVGGEARKPDPPHMPANPTELTLSEGQQAFARGHDATPAWRAGDSSAIFMYRVTSEQTTRWLVDEAGRVLEFSVFHRLAHRGDRQPNRGTPPPLSSRTGYAARSAMEPYSQGPSSTTGTDADVLPI